MEKKVDARGLKCPLPVIETKKALEEMKESGKITVTVDNEIAAQNVMKLAKQKKVTAEYTQISKEELVVTLQVGETQINKSDQTSQKDIQEVLQECEDCQIEKKKTVVVISSNCMGQGDEKLGKILIKGFIFALSKQDVLPDIILFYNSGVQLVSESSESLEDLKNMEEDGVEIIACGTCLDYYQLTEKQKIGSVTNMYSIAEMMLNAELIVKP